MPQVIELQKIQMAIFLGHYRRAVRFHGRTSYRRALSVVLAAAIVVSISLGYDESRAQPPALPPRAPQFTHHSYVEPEALGGAVQIFKVGEGGDASYVYLPMPLLEIEPLRAEISKLQQGGADSKAIHELTATVHLWNADITKLIAEAAIRTERGAGVTTKNLGVVDAYYSEVIAIVGDQEQVISSKGKKRAKALAPLPQTLSASLIGNIKDLSDFIDKPRLQLYVYTRANQVRTTRVESYLEGFLKNEEFLRLVGDENVEDSVKYEQGTRGASFSINLGPFSTGIGAAEQFAKAERNAARWITRDLLETSFDNYVSRVGLSIVSETGDHREGTDFVKSILEGWIGTFKKMHVGVYATSTAANNTVTEVTLKPVAGNLNANGGQEVNLERRDKVDVEAAGIKAGAENDRKFKLSGTAAVAGDKGLVGNTVDLYLATDNGLIFNSAAKYQKDIVTWADLGSHPLNSETTVTWPLEKSDVLQDRIVVNEKIVLQPKIPANVRNAFHIPVFSDYPLRTELKPWVYGSFVAGAPIVSDDKVYYVITRGPGDADLGSQAMVSVDAEIEFLKEKRQFALKSRAWVVEWLTDVNDERSGLIPDEDGSHGLAEDSQLKALGLRIPAGKEAVDIEVEFVNVKPRFQSTFLVTTRDVAVPRGAARGKEVRWFDSGDFDFVTNDGTVVSRLRGVIDGTGGKSTHLNLGNDCRIDVEFLANVLVRYRLIDK